MSNEITLPDGYCFNMVQADQCFGKGELCRALLYINQAERFSSGSDYEINEISEARKILAELTAKI
jgi:hypothetical protein